MLCVFFSLCLCTRECVKIILKFQTLEVVFDRKMNLVGSLGKFFEILNSCKTHWEKPKKN
ncbi:hypothetical protein FWK35_00017215 [Aphis craccivora]|uniref:Uncharacterized protein n=1 Tax=Aphis craccivora TaxID=307492 RepID=A0A6G0ZQM8_APHCR|nr:hypothetical protein FWK35_00017215 [Aphis craccivora]